MGLPQSLRKINELMNVFHFIFYLKKKKNTALNVPGDSEMRVL